MWNPLTEAAMEDQNCNVCFQTKVAAVSMLRWLSQMSVMTITDTGFLVLYPSENSFQKFLVWVQVERAGYKGEQQTEEGIRTIFAIFSLFQFTHITNQHVGEGSPSPLVPAPQPTAEVLLLAHQQQVVLLLHRLLHYQPPTPLKTRFLSFLASLNNGLTRCKFRSKWYQQTHTACEHFFLKTNDCVPYIVNRLNHLFQ